MPQASLASGSSKRRELLYGENVWQILGLPLRIFFSGRDDNPQYFDGVLTPMLVLLAALGIQRKMERRKKLIALFAFGYLCLPYF